MPVAIRKLPFVGLRVLSFASVVIHSVIQLSSGDTLDDTQYTLSLSLSCSIYLLYLLTTLQHPVIAMSGTAKRPGGVSSSW